MHALTANDIKTRGVAAIERELDAALVQSRADEAAGRYVAESAQAHMARLDALLEAGTKPAKAGRKKTAAR